MSRKTLLLNLSLMIAANFTINSGLALQAGDRHNPHRANNSQAMAAQTQLHTLQKHQAKQPAPPRMASGAKSATWFFKPGFFLLLLAAQGAPLQSQAQELKPTDLW